MRTALIRAGMKRARLTYLEGYPVSKRTSVYAAVSALCICASGCSDLSSPAIQPVQPNRSLSAAATLTGRIVYTLSGKLRIYNVATKADVSLGVSGVNPKFSPSGALITHQGSGGIWVMSSDGTNKRVLNPTGATPSFDPTSTMVAFGDNGIWKINVDGTGLTQLTNVGRQPAWSPDGTQIAHVAPVGSAEQLFVMNADGSNRRQVLSSAAVIDPVWLPSSKLLFGLLSTRNNYELHSFDPTNASSLTRLTTNKGNDFEPSWSPDGSGISWTSGLGGIWIMNADGSGKQGPLIGKGRQGSWGM
jgi:WD40 repeat protein